MLHAAPIDGSDVSTVKSLLSIRAASVAIPNPGFHVVAEVNSADTAASLQALFGENLVTVSSDAVVAELVVVVVDRRAPVGHREVHPEQRLAELDLPLGVLVLRLRLEGDVVLVAVGRVQRDVQAEREVGRQREVVVGEVIEAAVGRDVGDVILVDGDRPQQVAVEVGAVDRMTALLREQQLGGAFVDAQSLGMEVAFARGELRGKVDGVGQRQRIRERDRSRAKRHCQHEPFQHA